jgi:hypothetical protein
VLDFTRVNEEVDDFGDQSWAVEKHWFFGGEAVTFRHLFGRVDFELAYTLLISIWSSVSALSIDVSYLYLCSYEETLFVCLTNLSLKCAYLTRTSVPYYIPILCR